MSTRIEQFYGGGRNFSGQVAAGAPDWKRVYTLGPNPITLGLFALPKTTLRRSLKVGSYMYVINYSGSSVDIRNTSDTFGSVGDGEIARVTLTDLVGPSGIGGWRVDTWTFNPTSGRTHGETPRPDFLIPTITNNTRAAVATPDCDVWVLEDCADPPVLETLYSRQEGWAEYEGQAVNFTFDENDTDFRSVSRATSITKPVDTRDLLSLVDLTKGSCFVAFVDNWEFSDTGFVDWRQALGTPDKNSYTRTYDDLIGNILTTTESSPQAGAQVGDQVLHSPWSLSNGGFTVRVDFEDDNNCVAPRGTPTTAGYNPNTQSAGATATINVVGSVDMTVDFTGLAERQDTGFENLTLTVDKGTGSEVVVATATSPGGNLGCPGGNGPVVLTSGSNPVTVNLGSGDHTLTVDVTTSDPLYHINAYYQIAMSFVAS